jgi:hypothetical protein
MRIEGLSERIVEASSHMAMQCAEPLAAFSMSKAPDTPICLMAWASAFFCPSGVRYDRMNSPFELLQKYQFNSLSAEYPQNLS